MINQKFENIIKGYPESLNSQEVKDLGVHCAGQNLSLDNLIAISLTLFKQSKENCLEFLQFIQKHQMGRTNYRDFIHQPYKIKIYNNLAALTLAKAIRQSDKEGMQKSMNDFQKYLNSSEKVKNTLQKSIIPLRGFLLYYNGDFAKANNVFIKAYDDNSRQNEANLPIPALLGLAQISFIRKSYAKSLEYYKKALTAKKSLPVHARLGMAYCFYELHKYELAELCFKRILKLQPMCAEAYLGLAVLSYKNENYQQYFELLQQSYKLDPKNPCTILHIAEHYFFKGDLLKAIKFCQKGLQLAQKMPKFVKCEQGIRNEYEQYKSRFHNIIAQIHHSQQQYQPALKHYLEAKGKGLNFNQVGLAQTYVQANMLKDALAILEPVFNNTPTKDSKLIGYAFKTLAYLQMKTGKYSHSRGPSFYFKQSLKFYKNDYETLIDYSVYLSQTNEKIKTLRILLDAEQTLNSYKKDQPDPQFLNNIAVYLIEANEFKSAYQYLVRSCQRLQKIPKQNPAEQLRYHSLFLVCNFNMAIALQKMNMLQQASRKHEELIAKNKYYMDSYSRLAFIQYKKLGNRNYAFKLLNDALEIANQTPKANIPSRMIDMLRLDKIMTAKAHLLHLDNSNGEAKQIFRKMGKKKYAFQHFYELCLGYETIMKKNLQFSVVKDFIRPNREYVINICQHQHNNLYSYMILIILLLADGRISRQQGVLFFNQLKIAELQFPQVLLNFGIFLLLNNDYQNALFSLNRYQEKIKSHKVDEYIALAQFLSGNYEQCIKTIKKNILNEPNNLKNRFQYAYVIEKWVQKLYEQQNNFKHLKESEKTLIMCREIYTALSKTHPSQYIRQLQNPDMKQKVKTEISKIRSLSQDRKRFVQSQIEFYGKKKGQIIEKQLKIKQQEQRKLDQLDKAKKTKELLEQIEGQADMEDEEKQKMQRKRQRLIQMSRQQSSIFTKAWEEQNEKLKLQIENGKNKRGGKREKKPRKAQENIDRISDHSAQESESFKDNQKNSYDMGDDEIVYEKKKGKDKGKKSRKHKKQKKKKNKERRHSEKEDDDDSDKSKSQRNAQELNDENDSDSGSGFERQHPQKERKKKEEQDDDLGIDLGNYLINEE